MVGDTAESYGNLVFFEWFLHSFDLDLRSLIGKLDIYVEIDGTFRLVWLGFIAYQPL